MVLKVFCRAMSADNRVCAERFIRSLAGERKNSLFFGSDKMAGVSAVYHGAVSVKGGQDLCLAFQQFP